MARVPDFIKKNRVGYRAPSPSRQYKYTPPIPALAIRFEDPKQTYVANYQSPEDDFIVLAAETGQFLISDGVNYYLQPNS